MIGANAMFLTTLCAWAAWLPFAYSPLSRVEAVSRDSFPKPVMTIAIKPDGDSRADVQWMGFTPSGGLLAVRHVRPGYPDATITVFNTSTGKAVTSTAIKAGGGRAYSRSLNCGISPTGDWVAYVEGRRIKFLTIPPNGQSLPRRGDITLSDSVASTWADVWLDAKGEAAYVTRRFMDGFATERWVLAKGAGRRIPALDTAPNELAVLTVNATAHRLAMGFELTGQKPRIDCWILADKPPKTSIELPRRVESLALAPDGGRVAAGFGDGSVAWYNTVTGKPVGKLPRIARFTVGTAAFHPGGKYLACGSFDRGAPNLFLIDTTSGEVLHKIVADPNGVMAVCFSTSGSQLAAFGASGTVTIWDATKLLKLERD